MDEEILLTEIVLKTRKESLDQFVEFNYREKLMEEKEIKIQLWLLRLVFEVIDEMLPPKAIKAKHAS